MLARNQQDREPMVLLTRLDPFSTGESETHTILRRAGAAVKELPMINFALPTDTTELDKVLMRASVGEFAAIVLSSPTAAHFLALRANELGLVGELRKRGAFGAVGNATAAAMLQHGFQITLPIPSSGGSAQLSALLAEQNLSDKPVLLLQSQIGLGVLEGALAEIGAEAERVTLYHTMGPRVEDLARLLHYLEYDPPAVIAFFSPSAVTHFTRALAEMASGLLHNLPALACIGETTAKAVEEALHRRPEIVARKADQRTLGEGILHYLDSHIQRN